MENLIEQFVDEDSDGVFAISLVSDPAIEKDFIMLSKNIKLSLDSEKKLVTGAILVPDQPILRIDENGDPYHIFFSKETVEQASQKYLKDFNQASVTLEHQVEVPDVVLIESWIKTDETHDKTVALGVEAPLGSWVGSFKVNNDDIWNNEIKKGLVRGFSIEGIFRQDNVKQSKHKKMEKDNLLDKIKELVLGKEEAPKEAPVVVEMATQEEVTKLCATVASLEETIKGMQTKLEELSKPEEIVVEDVKVEDVQAKEEEEVEEKVEEPVEMIAVTDNVDSAPKKVMFDYKLSREERIRQNIVK